MSDSVWPHGLQHTRLPCPSLPPRVCSNACPLSQWCHPTVSSSVASFPSCTQSFPASGSFPVSWLIITRWSEDWSFSFSISPSSEYSGLISFRVDWFDLLVLKGLSRIFSSTIVRKHQFFSTQPSLWTNFLYSPALSRLYMTTGKIIALTKQTFVSKVMSLLFNPYSL